MTTRKTIALTIRTFLGKVMSLLFNTLSRFVIAVFPRSKCLLISWLKLDHKEGWKLKNWCFQIVVLEKTLESLLDSKEIKPVNPKGNQPWVFMGKPLLKLKLQFFGHLMRRADSLEKILMLEKIEDRLTMLWWFQVNGKGYCKVLGKNASFLANSIYYWWQYISKTYKVRVKFPVFEQYWNSQMEICFMCEHRRVQLFATPWTVARQAPLYGILPGKNTGVGGHF